MASNVRQVLTYVESGNADLGVIYMSDAKVAKHIKILAEAHPKWHKPIVYPGAMIKESTHSKEAQAFLSYLASEEAKKVLLKYGFK
jgi:molybdate transport system substrate-binding protein